MFKNLQNTITKLNADVSDTLNQEKAKKLRKKLIAIGLSLAIIGFVGVFVCFTLFATAGFDAFGEHGFTARVIVPFVLFIPFGMLGGVGSMLASLGFKILIAGETTKFVDKSINVRCECGNMIKTDVKFCPACGKQVRKTCSKCNTVNDPNSKFCTNCGEKL